MNSPRSDDAALDLIWRAACQAMKTFPEWLDSVEKSTIEGPGMTAVARDPELRNWTARAVRSNLMHWVSANIARPGQPVPANTDRTLYDEVRNQVRRGIDTSEADSYRAGQNAAWLEWMRIVFSLTDDLATAEKALTISSRSIASFIDATESEVDAAIREEREDIVRSARATRFDIVERALSGQWDDADRVGRLLDYPLGGQHTAVIVWSVAETPDQLAISSTADWIVRRWRAPRSIQIFASAGTLWMWANSAPAELPVAHIPDGIQVAYGAPAANLPGFRSSHEEALTAQRALSRLRSPRKVVSFDDVLLVGLVAHDAAAAHRFVQRTLGRFIRADAATQSTLRTFLHKQSSVSQTALAVHAHRNTVLRRIARAEDLLPRPLASNAVAVAVALDILYWQSDSQR